MNYRMENIKDISFWRVDSDYYGNPRYVFHFLELADTYERAIEIAKTFGGKRYRAKWYGGGIVLVAYSLEDVARNIIVNRENGPTTYCESCGKEF